MKKVERVVISSVLVTSMLFSITSCDKAGKMCTDHSVRLINIYVNYKVKNKG